MGGVEWVLGCRVPSEALARCSSLRSQDLVGSRQLIQHRGLSAVPRVGLQDTACAARAVYQRSEPEILSSKHLELINLVSIKIARRLLSYY